MQLVDPFIPVSRQSTVKKDVSKVSGRNYSVDGMTARKPVTLPRRGDTAPFRQRPHATLQKPLPQGRSGSYPAVRSDSFSSPFLESQSEPKPPTKLKRMSLFIGKLSAFAGLLVAGLFIQSVAVGQLLILAYAVFALVMKIESRTTFILALIALGVVLLTSAGINAGLSSTFAVYAFLLLVVGTLSLGIEVLFEA